MTTVRGARLSATLPGPRYSPEELQHHLRLKYRFSGEQLAVITAPPDEPLLVVAGTVAGCLLLHEGLIRRVGWLRPLFGHRRQRLPPMCPAAGGAAAGSPETS